MQTEPIVGDGLEKHRTAAPPDPDAAAPMETPTPPTAAPIPFAPPAAAPWTMRPDLERISGGADFVISATDAGFAASLRLRRPGNFDPAARAAAAAGAIVVEIRAAVARGSAQARTNELAAKGAEIGAMLKTATDRLAAATAKRNSPELLHSPDLGRVVMELDAEIETCNRLATELRAGQAVTSTHLARAQKSLEDEMIAAAGAAVARADGAAWAKRVAVVQKICQVIRPLLDEAVAADESIAGARNRMLWSKVMDGLGVPYLPPGDYFGPGPGPERS